MKSAPPLVYVVSSINVHNYGHKCLLLILFIISLNSTGENHLVFIRFPFQAITFFAHNKYCNHLEGVTGVYCIGFLCNF